LRHDAARAHEKFAAGALAGKSGLELLHKVTDLYFEGVGQHTTSESYLFNEIMERIVDMFLARPQARKWRQISRSSRIFPSNHRAQSSPITRTPKVARPVLRKRASSLTEDDLGSPGAARLAGAPERDRRALDAAGKK